MQAGGINAMFLASRSLWLPSMRDVLQRCESKAVEGIALTGYSQDQQEQYGVRCRISRISQTDMKMQGCKVRSTSQG
jgi:hypothetical protein